MNLFGGMELESQVSRSSVQTSLWRLTSASHSLKAWEGKLNTKDDGHTLSFRRNQTQPFIACVPYQLLKGRVQWPPNNYGISRESCSLHTCINSSVSLNVTPQSLYSLRGWPAVLWVPLKLSKPWCKTYL